VKDFPLVDETGLSSMNLFDIAQAYQYTMLDAAVEGELETNPTLYMGMHSYTVNAFYSPTTNEFVILNGLLSGGFVSEEKEVTYARVGTVIGHEISHAFDSSGAYYDEYGRYKQTGWWEKDDMKEFKNRVSKLRKFWNNINLYVGRDVNGSQIDGEATADMGGVAVMLKLAKKIKNFDYDTFFRAYASLWKEEYSDLSGIDQDSHPYAYLRCNVTLAQFDEFVKTYHLKSGDGMYIPKDERVKIW
jgi:putative endopeptidase